MPPQSANPARMTILPERLRIVRVKPEFGGERDMRVRARVAIGTITVLLGVVLAAGCGGSSNPAAPSGGGGTTGGTGGSGSSSSCTSAGPLGQAKGTITASINGTTF